MDGRGRVFYNIFVERLWRSLKYEEIYLEDYGDVWEAEEIMGDYFMFYNKERPHSDLDYRTPEEVYFNEKELRMKEDKLSLRCRETKLNIPKFYPNNRGYLRCSKFFNNAIVKRYKICFMQIR